AVVVRLARRRNGRLHLVVGRLADLGERLLVRRVDRRVALLRLDPLAADEQAVALPEPDDVARLRRRRVRPVGRNGGAILLSLELGPSRPSLAASRNVTRRRETPQQRLRRAYARRASRRRARDACAPSAAR